MIKKSETTIVVTGATGNQGSAVADKLFDEGWKVRALTRNPDQPYAKHLAEKGIEVVKGDLNNRPSLDNALDGVCGVFAVHAWAEDGVSGEVRQGRNLADAAKAAGIRHYVYSSVIAADRKTGIPHFESKGKIEEYIKSTGLRYTFLRPGFYMFNFERDQLKNSILDGVLSLAIKPDKVHQMLSPEDFAYFVALAFDKPREYIGKALDIVGDEMTMPEAAKVFSRVIGKPVEYRELPLEQVLKQNEDLGRMFNWFNETNYRVDLASLKKIRPEMMTLEQYLIKHGWREAAGKYRRAA
ncbi:MAG: NmrA/HSCARG family protein [Nitrospirota bacterium]